MSAQLVPLTSILSVYVDLRRCNFDRLGDVDLELGRRLRDALVAENLAGFLPDPSPPAPIAARTCSGLTVAARATTARRLAEIRAAWSHQRRGSPVTTAELLSSAVVASPAHRVECPCGWIGYRLSPWCRDCPACGIDRSKLRPVWLAGCAPRRGRCCYLAEIWPAYRHAQHYLGFTTDLPRRWPEHLAGGYDPETHRNNGPGSRLLAAALYAGCTVELVRVWYGSQARALEQRLKQRRKPDTDSLRAGAARSLKPLCPVCNPAGWWRRYPDLPDPPPPPPRRRFVHDPVLWDAAAEWNLAFPELAYPESAAAAAALQVGGLS